MFRSSIHAANLVSLLLACVREAVSCSGVFIFGTFRRFVKSCVTQFEIKTRKVFGFSEPKTSKLSALDAFNLTTVHAHGSACHPLGRG